MQLCYLARDLEQETSTATASTFLEESYKPGLLPGMEASGTHKTTITPKIDLGGNSAVRWDDSLTTSPLTP